MFLLALQENIRPIEWHDRYGDQRVTHRVTYRVKDIVMCPAAPLQGRQSEVTASLIAMWQPRELGNLVQFSVGVGGNVETTLDLTASWRDMYISSPPLIAISLDLLPDVPEHSYSLTIWNPTGVKLGELYDWTWKLGRSFERSTGHRLDGRLTVASFWLVDPRDQVEFEEAW